MPNVNENVHMETQYMKASVSQKICGYILVKQKNRRIL